MTTVQITTQDSVNFNVDKDLICYSETIKHMIEDGIALDSGIPLPNVSSEVFQKILVYLEHYTKTNKDDNKKATDNANKKVNDNDDKTAEPEAKNEDIDDWHKTFFDYSNIHVVGPAQSNVFEIILAANYLDIKPLLNIACQAIANVIKGKTPDEIRKAFDIENDFTPEEEEQVRRENEWCESK